MDVNPYKSPRAISRPKVDLSPACIPFAYKAIAIGYLAVIVGAFILSLFLGTQH
jgi:hypothetical protein